MLESIQEKTNEVAPVNVFCSYAEADEKLKEELEKHLTGMSYEGLIALWHDRKILAGADRTAEINEQFDQANLYLLLVSPDFISSKYCYQVEAANAIRKHKEGAACVVPVIVRPVDWQRTPLGQLEPLPKDGKALTTWDNLDTAMRDVAEGLRKRVLDMRNGKEKTHNITRQTTYQLIIDGTLKDFDSAKLDKIMTALRELSADANLTLKSVRSGSVILELNGSDDGYKNLLRLQELGLLSDYLQLNVISVCRKPFTGNANAEQQSKSTPPESVANLYIGNLSWDIKDEDLYNLLEDYCKVISAKVITDKVSSRSRGFAFAEVPEADANYVVEQLNGTELNGRILIVNIARPASAEGIKRVRRIHNRRDKDQDGGAMF